MSPPLKTALNTLVADASDTDRLAALIRHLRPVGDDTADDRIVELTAVLRDDEALRETIDTSLRSVLGSHRLVHALAESGILSDRGLPAELIGRIAGRFLPLPSPDNDVRRLIRMLFDGPGDWRWVGGVAPEHWTALFSLFVRDDDMEGIPADDIAAAILGLAQRAGALGIDEELSARLPTVEDYESSFLDLTPLARAFLDDHATGPGSDATLDQLVERMTECRQLVEHIRENKGTYGTSLRMTAITRRLLQQLRRMEILVHLVHPRDVRDFARSLAPVFTEIVEAELTSRSISRLLREHADLFAFQISEETAKKGIKYVTDSAAGYWAFLRKAMFGGAIVAVFALVKAWLYKLDLSLGGRAFLYSVNYAACFVLIYLTGSILATKQPAMTASAIGRRLDQAASDEDAVEAVGEMVVKVWRSQFVSFVGNLICAFPVAILLTWTLGQLDVSLVDGAKARKLFGEIAPFTSGAFLFAAVAGVYLFLSGVFSGWLENLSVYVQLERRLRHLPWPESLRSTGERVATFVTGNLGVVAGNVVLGFMLGTAGTIGIIFGVPFDIRHIAFSSANFGMAIQAAPELATWQRVAMSALGVFGIGFVNFIVSFGLTLVTTLESRQTSFAQWRHLARHLTRLAFTRTRDWYLPPRSDG